MSICKKILLSTALIIGMTATTFAQMMLDLDPKPGDQSKRSTVVKPGEIKTIQVLALGGAKDIQGFEIELWFDPKKIGIKGCNPGPLMAGAMTLPVQNLKPDPNTKRLGGAKVSVGFLGGKSKGDKGILGTLLIQLKKDLGPGAKIALVKGSYGSGRKTQTFDLKGRGGIITLKNSQAQPRFSKPSGLTTEKPSGSQHKPLGKTSVDGGPDGLSPIELDLNLSPGDQGIREGEVTAGDMKTVQILALHSVKDIRGFELDLRFNPKLVSIKGLNLGSLTKGAMVLPPRNTPKGAKIAIGFLKGRVKEDTGELGQLLIQFNDPLGKGTAIGVTQANFALSAGNTKNFQIKRAIRFHNAGGKPSVPGQEAPSRLTGPKPLTGSGHSGGPSSHKPSGPQHQPPSSTSAGGGPAGGRISPVELDLNLSPGDQNSWESNAKPGDMKTIQVLALHSAKDIRAFELDFKFDPKVVKIKAFNLGSLAKGGISLPIQNVPTGAKIAVGFLNKRIIEDKGELGQVLIQLSPSLERTVIGLMTVDFALSSENHKKFQNDRGPLSIVTLNNSDFEGTKPSTQRSGGPPHPTGSKLPTNSGHSSELSSQKSHSPGQDGSPKDLSHGQHSSPKQSIVQTIKGLPYILQPIVKQAMAAEKRMNLAHKLVNKADPKMKEGLYRKARLADLSYFKASKNALKQTKRFLSVAPQSQRKALTQALLHFKPEDLQYPPGKEPSAEELVSGILNMLDTKIEQFQQEYGGRPSTHKAREPKHKPGDPTRKQHDDRNPKEVINELPKPLQIFYRKTLDLEDQYEKAFEAFRLKTELDLGKTILSTLQETEKYIAKATKAEEKKIGEVLTFLNEKDKDGHGGHEPGDRSRGKPGPSGDVKMMVKELIKEFNQKIKDLSAELKRLSQQK